MRIYQYITQLIGRTPLLEMVNYEREHLLYAKNKAKL